jgi:ABC-type glycerol-3-phosphate transport system substrate-binding protein
MLFVAQKIAFTFSGSACLLHAGKHADNWGITYMPKIDGKTGSDMGGKAVRVSKDHYPNAVAIFIDYATSKEVVRKFCETRTFSPSEEPDPGGNQLPLTRPR